MRERGVGGRGAGVVVDFNVLSTGHGQPTTKRERERQTDRQSGTERQRDTHRELRTLLHKDYDFRQFWKETDRQTKTETDRQTDRDRHRDRDTQREWILTSCQPNKAAPKTKREREREIERERDGQNLRLDWLRQRQM